MSQKSPAFQFYPKDYLSDANVKAMTFEERGVYVELLCLYWLEGGLPSEVGRLARLVGMPTKRFARLWVAISRCFAVDGERILQKRVEIEKAKQAAFRVAQRVKGQKSAKSKQVNNAKQPRLDSGCAPVVTEINPPFPFAVSTSKNGNDKPAPVGANSWIASYAEAWKARYGGDPEVGPLLKALSPPRRMHGDAVTLARWKLYLAATAAEFTNPAKFAATFGAWTPEALAARRTANGTTTAHVESGVRATVDNRPKGDLEPARKWVVDCGGAEAARAKVTAYSKANAIPENIALADIAPPYAYIALQEAERKPS